MGLLIPQHNSSIVTVNLLPVLNASNFIMLSLKQITSHSKRNCNTHSSRQGKWPPRNIRGDHIVGAEYAKNGNTKIRKSHNASTGSGMSIRELSLRISSSIFICRCQSITISNHLKAFRQENLSIITLRARHDKFHYSLLRLKRSMPIKVAGKNMKENWRITCWGEWMNKIHSFRERKLQRQPGLARRCQCLHEQKEIYEWLLYD